MVEMMADRLTDAWARTDRIFEMLAPDSWLAQPIALRHPFIFYLGHLPAFAWNHVGRALLERPSFDAAFDDLFSRGIDPDVDDPSRCHDHPDVPNRWPAVEQVIAYRDRVRGSLLDAARRARSRSPRARPRSAPASTTSPSAGTTSFPRCKPRYPPSASTERR